MLFSANDQKQLKFLSYKLLENQEISEALKLESFQKDLEKRHNIAIREAFDAGYFAGTTAKVDNLNADEAFAIYLNTISDGK